jgi:hypothetical protein
MWDRYEPDGADITKLVLYRNENGGVFRPVKEFHDLTKTEYVDDERLKHNRTYCYKLLAQTADGITSDFSTQACGKPRK